MGEYYQGEKSQGTESSKIAVAESCRNPHNPNHGDEMTEP
jgi:hypothetical protein